MSTFETPLKIRVDLSAPRHFWAAIFINLTSRYLVLCLIVFVLSVSQPAAQSQDPISSQDGSNGNYTLRVDANLVILNATVLDRHNALVSGLFKDDFQVYENHVLQSIKHFSHEDIPVTVGLVIDNSGSMGPKRADVIAAGLSFAHSSNPEDQMFVVNFNEHVSFGLPVDIPFTGQQDQLQLAFASIRTIGETALYDAIATALNHLKQGKCDKKVLIVISDGGDNASKHSLNQVIEMAKKSDAIIYTIGIFDGQDDDRNPGVLRRFAKETGGEAFFPQSSKEIPLICEGIARDIRNQYTLAYVPTIPKLDGGYRIVEVKVSSPGYGRLSIRTRAGYSLPLATLANGSRVDQP
ncbi:MAG: VWA domain-containing protein [Terracidiphilus sp.]